MEIVKQLKAEKYDYSQIEGPALKKQLLQMILNAERSNNELSNN